MVRFIIILGLGVIGITVALAFYHPPMRLMPAPEVFLDGEVNAFSADPALAEDPRISLFYATNRLPVGPHSNRLYTVVPGRDLHMASQRSDGRKHDLGPDLPCRRLGRRRPALLTRQPHRSATSRPNRSGQPMVRRHQRLLKRSRDRTSLSMFTAETRPANTPQDRLPVAALHRAQFGRGAFAWPTAEISFAILGI